MIDVWLPRGADDQYGSLRLRGVRVTQAAQGARVVTEPEVHRGRVLLVPQKVVTAERLETLRKLKGRFVLDLCEVFTDPAHQAPYDEARSLAAGTSCASLALRDWTLPHADAVYVPDMVEVVSRPRREVATRCPLVLWYGFRENFLHLTEYFEQVRGSDLASLLLMTDREPRELRWNWQHLVRLLSVCDAGLAPVKREGPFHSVVELKSGHKILNFLSAGVPVFCGPLPEYQTILGDLYEPLLTATPEALLAKLSDFRRWVPLGTALRRLSRDYEPSAIGRRWNQTLRRWRA